MGAAFGRTQAKSYFIDTILREFPFPKVYFHERVDMATKRPRREIVDGQQRLSTIVEFVDDQFALSSNAGELQGKRFSDLSTEHQETFYSYTVSVDVIRNADRSEILQMFRRMNAFTLPLNAAEKRHSEFFGDFKDWINTVLDRYGALLVEWNILTSRQVVRMADAEFIADIALAIEEGIVSTSPTKLLGLYKRYDLAFPVREMMNERVNGSLDVILSQLSELRDTYLTRPHIFHSLICALIHNRFGLPNGEQALNLRPIGAYLVDRDRAIAGLKRLALAHEEKDVSEFKEYVQAASEGGNRAPQRAIRIRWLCQALRGNVA